MKFLSFALMATSVAMLYIRAEGASIAFAVLSLAAAVHRHAGLLGKEER